MNQDNYFDIWDIFANELVGSVWLTIIIGLALIYYFSARYNFSFQVSIMMGMLFLSVVAAITLNPLIWAFVVLFAGTLFYFMLSSKLRKG